MEHSCHSHGWEVHQVDWYFNISAYIIFVKKKVGHTRLQYIDTYIHTIYGWFLLLGVMIPCSFN